MARPKNETTYEKILYETLILACLDVMDDLNEDDIRDGLECRSDFSPYQYLLKATRNLGLTKEDWKS